MEKFIIYQAFTRLFGNKNNTNKPSGTIRENGCGKFNDFTSEAFKGIKELGATHIWYTGILEHASKTGYPEFGIQASPAEIVKGQAGSPYAIRDYYDVCPDLAEDVPNRMGEFENLVNRTHEADLKVIIDFVPNHVSRLYKSDAKPEGVFCLGEHDNQAEAFSPKNNYYYIPGQPLRLPNTTDPVQRGVFYEFPAKVTGNDSFTANPEEHDWYETVKLNYGVDYLNGHAKYFDPVPNTWYKMLEILSFWTDKGIDGFRCDMAEMVPVEFWEWVIPQIKEKNPSLIFIAEVYNPQLYREYIHKGRFDYLYDKVGLYDTLKGVLQGKQSATDITRCWQDIDDIKQHMLNFLENHDEQRIASEYFINGPFAILPALVISTCLHPGPYMHYFAQDVGEKAADTEGFSGNDGRTSIFDYWGVESHQQWMNKGEFDGANLTQEQKRLRKLYTDVLNFAKNEKCISEGLFYGLQWANKDNPEYDSEKIYSFLRYNDNEVLLFICNFSDEIKVVNLIIPDDAMEMSGLKRLCHFKGEEISFNFGSTEIEFAQKRFLRLNHETEARDVLIYRIRK
ncbi:alpha-amylase family glycosyl hydrolase [Saccharicrinis sp. FJH54]|uniref:alpha-amylase family glycosyl hydrolase n=1 Tax=Saccharicrinis sp. FJH54 TaxID=3344665 RepID=UPI0035D4C698